MIECFFHSFIHNTKREIETKWKSKILAWGAAPWKKSQLLLLVKNKISTQVMFIICKRTGFAPWFLTKQMKIQSDFLSSRYWPNSIEISVSKPNRKISACFDQYLELRKFDWIFVCFLETVAPKSLLALTSYFWPKGERRFFQLAPS
jgi:hypothetical protein